MILNFKEKNWWFILLMIKFIVRSNLIEYVSMKYSINRFYDRKRKYTISRNGYYRVILSIRK